MRCAVVVRPGDARPDLHRERLRGERVVPDRHRRRGLGHGRGRPRVRRAAPVVRERKRDQGDYDCGAGRHDERLDAHTRYAARGADWIITKPDVACSADRHAGAPPDGRMGLMQRVLPGGLLVDYVAQLVQSESHPSFDGARWQSEQLRDLGVREPAVEGQRDDLPLRLRNPAKQAPELFTRGAGGIGVGPGGRRGGIAGWLGGLVSTARLCCPSMDEAHRPCVHGFVVGAVPGPLSPRDGESIVEDPLDTVAAPAQRAGEEPGSVLVAVVEQLERTVIVGLHAPHQRFVAQRGRRGGAVHQLPPSVSAGGGSRKNSSLAIPGWVWFALRNATTRLPVRRSIAAVNSSSAPSWNATRASITSRLAPWETSADSPVVRMSSSTQTTMLSLM